MTADPRRGPRGSAPGPPPEPPPGPARAGGQAPPDAPGPHRPRPVGAGTGAPGPAATREPAVPAAVRERIAADPFCRLLGIHLEALAPGYARLSMTVRPDMANFHGVGHGGAVFALADAAHAAASNSHGVPAVALHVGLHYVAPARPGERLVAEAWEEDRGRRTALYRLAVRRHPDGRLVAAGHGRVFREEPGGGSPPRLGPGAGPLGADAGPAGAARPGPSRDDGEAQR